MSPLTQRAEDGSVTFTDLGGFVFLLVLGTTLGLLHGGFHHLYPNTSPNNSALVVAFVTGSYSSGKNENWAVRTKEFGLILLAYAWCVSLACLLSGGDRVFYAWVGLILFISPVGWLIRDYTRREKR